MNADGIAMNDYFLYALILAYGNSKPKQCERAEAATRKAVATGIHMNHQLVGGLTRVLGRSAAEALASELSSVRSFSPRLRTGAPR